MSDVWTVQVAGQIYGPYPLDHMKAFIAEGRIVAKSLVAYGSDTQFHPAGDDLVLRSLLARSASSEAEIEFQPAPQAMDEAFVESLHSTEADTRAHVLIFTDINSRSTSAIEDAIYALGPAFPVLPQVWFVKTNESVQGIRKVLAQRLGTLDALLVVDATNDKIAWTNISLDKESRIRRMWDTGLNK